MDYQGVLSGLLGGTGAAGGAGLGVVAVREGTLARTGLDALLLVGVALGCILIGLVLVSMAMRVAQRTN